MSRHATRDTCTPTHTLVRTLSTPHMKEQEEGGREGGGEGGRRKGMGGGGRRAHIQRDKVKKRVRQEGHIKPPSKQGVCVSVCVCEFSRP